MRYSLFIDLLHNQSIGSCGEQLALRYLRRKGYRIISNNFHTRWGEIDIIATKERKLSFIEVKTRLSTQYGKPHEAITPHKIKHLSHAISYFLLQKKYKDYKLSIDAVSVILNRDRTAKEIRYFESISVIERR